MKTAIKVINDRIKILETYLEDTKEKTDDSIQLNRSVSIHAKEMFLELRETIENYNQLLSSGVNNEDLCDKIKELVGSTMVPLVERNKQIIDSYKQMMFSLYQKSEEIKAKGNDISDADKKELNDINIALIDYDKAKKDVQEYLDEYEAALEEIKELVIEKEVEQITGIIDQSVSAAANQEEENRSEEEETLEQKEEEEPLEQNTENTDNNQSEFDQNQEKSNEFPV